eukprot:COSAG02_NODE_1124_length_14441_cov_21.457607_5_plen_30_part_00
MLLVTGAVLRGGAAVTVYSGGEALVLLLL